MPVPLLAHGVVDGISTIPYAVPILKTSPWIVLVALLKRYFGGARNTSDRRMYSKVVMITGGTSGIGASIAQRLASQGAQIILLTQHAPSDPFLIDYVEDLRNSTGNQLVYAEQVDLSSLYSVRTFATKWVDNAPPRRLDMIILCANIMKPSRAKPRTTIDSLDEEWQVNYLANYHLLSILSPALRAQPADRDVRVIFGTCSSYIGATLDFKHLEDSTMRPAAAKPFSSSKPATNRSSNSTTKPSKSPNKNTAHSTQAAQSSMYATSKLALMIFAKSFQSHLSAYQRPDKQPCNTRVLVVDPGFSRTPGTRRWLTAGSLFGLIIYLITWPIWWLVLKSPQQGAQSFLTAAMEAVYGAPAANIGGVRVGAGIAGGMLIKECRERDVLRKEIVDEHVGKQLWEFSSWQIELREKEGAVRRALEKKKREVERKKEGAAGSTAAAATAITSTTSATSAAAAGVNGGDDGDTDSSQRQGSGQQKPGSRPSRMAKTDT
ncbi:oxidoreductase [Paracoccidioides lutzii Pb01]|uniref:Oxidoreductase n=1 Tax=Paracoccidioides lutzii (strain ATCC MYA-826 / Pb01) TaxID=502779 RepID=C1GVK2_PARBA|nr:oxidoreductase [Paracoccidioides lutzii Pb01]EEH40224.2 oxidoreductase [Paracoccidioides lutzii Pb01]